jgi:hypothetical protein
MFFIMNTVFLIGMGLNDDRSSGSIERNLKNDFNERNCNRRTYPDRIVCSLLESAITLNGF